MVPADHGGQVAGWIEAAPLRRAYVAQHGGALPHVRQLQRVTFQLGTTESSTSR